MQYAEATYVAQSLIERFQSVCHRIEIQGALRRLESTISEIELLVIPQSEICVENILLSGSQYLDIMLEDLFDLGLIQDKMVTEQVKRFGLVRPKISVQLHLVLPPATWGVSHVLGTGPGDFCAWATTKRKFGGILPDQYEVKSGAVWDTESGSKIETAEESDYFMLCGVDWIPPDLR